MPRHSIPSHATLRHVVPLRLHALPSHTLPSLLSQRRRCIVIAVDRALRLATAIAFPRIITNVTTSTSRPTPPGRNRSQEAAGNSASSPRPNDQGSADVSPFLSFFLSLGERTQTRWLSTRWEKRGKKQRLWYVHTYVRVCSGTRLTKLLRINQTQQGELEERGCYPKTGHGSAVCPNWRDCCPSRL